MTAPRQFSYRDMTVTVQLRNGGEFRPRHEQGVNAGRVLRPVSEQGSRRETGGFRALDVARCVGECRIQRMLHGRGVIGEDPVRATADFPEQAVA